MKRNLSKIKLRKKQKAFKNEEEMYSLNILTNDAYYTSTKSKVKKMEKQEDESIIKGKIFSPRKRRYPVP